jgi:hypothetical protein
MLACLTVFTGCKTSQDAAEAAKQMSATAKSLSDYYAALHTILTETEQIYALNEQLLAKPYTAETRQHLKNDEDALAKRAAFAKDFSTLADEFAKLTGSTAAADVSASADKLLTEADSLASVKASGAEQSLLKDALNLLVTSIKEHKEREAAKDIDTVAKILTDLFAKETDVWNSREAVHTQMAKNLAEYLADQDAVDNSAPLKVALDPFGLTPSVAHPDLSAKLAPLVKQQIATKAAACDDDYLKATDAMTKSLQEMSKRIRLVAEGKPMSFRLPPVTVDSVEQWATHLATY